MFITASNALLLDLVRRLVWNSSEVFRKTAVLPSPCDAEVDIYLFWWIPETDLFSPDPWFARQIRAKDSVLVIKRVSLIQPSQPFHSVQFLAELVQKLGKVQVVQLVLQHLMSYLFLCV